MATEGPNSPVTGANDASVGDVAWTNPGNITSSNNSRATSTLTNQSTQYLVATDFGFSIPAGATIDGITVVWERSGSTGNRVSDAAVRIVKGGTIGSTDKSSGTLWPTTAGETTATYGGASDLWGETWTDSDINASTFGAAIRGVVTASGITAQVDHVTITVNYTESSGVSGSLSATLANVTLSATGSVQMRGSLSKTLANVTLSATGSVQMRGSLSKTLDNITLSATGTTGSGGPVEGSLSATLANITLSATGSIQMRGSLSKTLANITLSATGTVSNERTGSLSATLANITLDASGSVRMRGNLSVTLANITLSATGSTTLAEALGIIIPSKSRSFTPSIVVSTPTWITASNFTDDSLAYIMESYSHTIVASGGYDTASLSAKMRIREAGRWFTRALGRDFAYYSPQGIKRWQGFINSITVNIGPLSYTIGPVIDIANRSRVLFSTKQYDTNPPIGGQETQTALANETTSQGRYGIFQTDLNGGSGLLAQMEEIRDVFLAENSEPFRDTAASFSADGEAQISLEMLGYYHLLKRYPYSSTTTGTQNASAKISAVLAADPSSRFSSSSLFIETNTTQVNTAERDNPYAWDVIQNVVAVGDGAGNRMLFGIYNDRVAHYESLPTTVTRQMLLSDPAQRVESISGALIYPWDMRPGVWVAVQDFIIGAQQAADLKSDFRNIMVETVSYTAPFGLSINGKKVETLPQILARYGISGI